MKIRRVILRGVNNFGRFDRCFEDDWMQRVPDSLLLIGPNGSGKTTLLEVIAGLWELFGELIQQGLGRLATLPPTISRDWELAAMEVVGLVDEPLWISYSASISNTLKESSTSGDQKGTHRLFTNSASPQNRQLKLNYFPPGAIEPVHRDQSILTWFENWQQSLTENMLGKRSDLPNLVFVQSEHRKVPALQEPFGIIREQLDEFRWLARYQPTTQRKGSLENYLFNLSAVDKPALDQILDQINSFLIGKRIVGFDRRTSALMVEVKGGARHPIDLLSSGEKQVLLMIAFITRWLRPGGIVLIDEPDLHLNVSLASSLVSFLRQRLTELDGQLIIASHEPELWRRFTQSHQVDLIAEIGQ